MMTSVLGVSPRFERSSLNPSVLFSPAPRPLQVDFWKMFFDVLLNVPQEGPLPNLADLRLALFECFVSSGRVGEVNRAAAELRGFFNA